MKGLKNLFATIIAMMTLTSCGTKEEPHTHIYNGNITTAATCTEDGVMTFVCECGDTYTEVIPATGHTYDEGVVTTPATCTEDGVKTFTCATCGHTYTETITATGHTYEETIVPATLTTPSYIAYECSCGDTDVEVLDMYTAYNVVAAFAEAFFGTSEGKVKSTTLKNGITALYIAANYATKYTLENLNTIINSMAGSLVGFEVVVPTSTSESGFISTVYAYTAEEPSTTLLALELSVYADSGNTIAQVLSYLVPVE